MKRWLFFLLPILFLCASNAFALRVSLSPQEIDLSSTGDRFQVAVNVSDVSDLGGFQFDLIYDPALVTIPSEADVSSGGFLESAGGMISPLGPVIDNSSGRLTFGAFIFGAETGAAGTGTIAKVTFAVQTPGQSALTLENVQLVTLQNSTVLTPDAVDGAILKGGEPDTEPEPEPADEPGTDIDEPEPAPDSDQPVSDADEPEAEPDDNQPASDADEPEAEPDDNQPASDTDESESEPDVSDDLPGTKPDESASDSDSEPDSEQPQPAPEDDNGAGNAPNDESPADPIPAEEEIGTDADVPAKVPAKVDTDDGDGGGGGGGSCFIDSMIR